MRRVRPSPMQGPMPRASFLFPAFVALTLAATGAARAVLPFHFGFFAPGPLDGITDALEGLAVGKIAGKVMVVPGGGT